MKNATLLIALFAIVAITLPASASAYGGGICINCGFVKPVEMQAPKIVCANVRTPVTYTFRNGHVIHYFVMKNTCHVEYETVTIKNRGDLNDLKARIERVWRSIVRGDGLRR